MVVKRIEKTVTKIVEVHYCACCGKETTGTLCNHSMEESLKRSREMRGEEIHQQEILKKHKSNKNEGIKK